MVLNCRYINFWKVSVLLFFVCFFEANLTKVERKQCTILNMYLHIHASSCVQKKPESRSLDSEATQCTVGKHCGHMLNIVYT